MSADLNVIRHMRTRVDDTTMMHVTREERNDIIKLVDALRKQLAEANARAEKAEMGDVLAALGGWRHMGTHPTAPAPITHRIADKAPEFPCWVWDSRKWIYERLRTFPTDTHWCSGIPAERPTHAPEAPAQGPSDLNSWEIVKHGKSRKLYKNKSGISIWVCNLEGIGDDKDGYEIVAALNAGEAAIASAMKGGDK